MGGRPAKSAKSSTKKKPVDLAKPLNPGELPNPHLEVALGVAGCCGVGKTTIQQMLFPQLAQHHGEPCYTRLFNLNKRIGDYNGEQFVVKSRDTNGVERFGAGGCSGPWFFRVSYYQSFGPWIFVVDLTAQFGVMQNDALLSNRRHLREIVEHGVGHPIVIFGNKTDLLFGRIWEKTKDIYLAFLFSRTHLATSSDAVLQKEKKKAKNSALTVSPFAECPREVVLSILFSYAALVVDFSDSTKICDRTEEYKALAKEFDIPIMFGSALNNLGIKELFEFIIEKDLEHRMEEFKTVFD